MMYGTLSYLTCFHICFIIYTAKNPILSIICICINSGKLHHLKTLLFYQSAEEWFKPQPPDANEFDSTTAEKIKPALVFKLQKYITM